MKQGWLLSLALVQCTQAAPTPLTSVARQLHRDGRLAESYAMYAEVLCASPGDLDLTRALVEVWQELGAAGDLHAVVAGCALTPEAEAYLAGLSAAVRGDVEAALVAMDRALAGLGGSQRVEVLYRKGLVLVGANRWLEAETTLAEAVGLAPARADLRLALAQSLLGQGRITEAAALVRGIMALTPSAVEVERARKVLRKIVEKSEPPLASDVDVTLKELLTSLERGTPTSEELGRLEVLRQKVVHPRVLTVAGLAALNRGLTREALSIFAEAASLAPLDAEPWRALGAGLVAAHREAEALPPLVEAYARDPFDVENTRLLAQVALAANDPGRARDMYQALTILVPSDSNAVLWLTRLERRLGHLAAAERAVRAGLVRVPKDVPMLVEAAVIVVERLQEKSASGDADPNAVRALGQQVLVTLTEVAPNHPMVAGLARVLK